MDTGARLDVKRVVLYAVGGWTIPGLIASPLFTVHESAGGEAAIFAGGVWLLVLGPIGCVVGGALVGALGRRCRDLSAAVMIGLGGVALAIVPIIAIDSAITVLTIEAVAVALVIPMLVAFLVGFVIGAVRADGSGVASPPGAAGES